MKYPAWPCFYAVVILFGIIYESTATSTTTSESPTTPTESSSPTIKSSTPTSVAATTTSLPPSISESTTRTNESSTPTTESPIATPATTYVSSTPITESSTTTTESSTTITMIATEKPTTSETTTWSLTDTTTITEIPTKNATTGQPTTTIATTIKLSTNSTTTTEEPPTTTSATTIELSTNSTTTTEEPPPTTNATTTELSTNSTTTTEEPPTTTNATTIELSTNSTTTTEEAHTTTNATTIELSTISTTTTDEPQTTTNATTTELSTISTTTTDEPQTTTNATTTELSTISSTTIIEQTTTTNATTTELLTNSTTTTEEPTTTTDATTIELSTNSTTTTEEPTTTTIETTTEPPTTIETTTAPLTTVPSTQVETTIRTMIPTTHSNSPSTETQTPISTTTQYVSTSPPPKCKPLTLKHGFVNRTDGENLCSVAIFQCNVGYNMTGTNTSQCKFVNGSDATWNPPPPICQIVDCGRWNETNNNYVTHTATTYQSSAVSICYTGYAAGTNTSTSTICLANGTWKLPTPPDCNKTLSCDALNITNYENVTYTNGLAVNSTASFKCGSGESIFGFKSITCMTPGDWSADPPKCRQEVVGVSDCPVSKDALDLQWNNTAPGEIATSECKDGYSGKIFRRCNDAGKWLLPVYNCVSEAIARVDTMVETIKNKEHVTEQDVTNVLANLTTATNSSGDDKDGVFGGELEKVTSILDTIVDISEKVNVTDEQTESFVNIASSLLNTKNTDSWKSISQVDPETEESDQGKPKGAAKVLDVVEKYSELIVKSLNANKTNTTVETENLVLHASTIDKERDVVFPDSSQNLTISTEFDLLKQYTKDINTYSAIVYKNISGIMSSKTSSDGNNSDSSYDINSAVISIKMLGVNSDDFKINITLGHLDDKSNIKRMCSFWNITINAWSDKGCVAVYNGSKKTICQCNHLTNFAILMSPWTEKNVISQAMDIISIIGCSVSLLGLLITVIIHIVLWRHLKSDRVVLLMNLSVALIVSYCLFIGGVDRTENEDLCTVIAVLLHYIYLAVFFLMLAEGIELAVILLNSFSSLKSRLKWMIPSAWLIPALIVSISIGVTQLEGYGNEQTCWLTVDQGLIWSFVAPALTVILINFVLLVISMKTIFGVKSLADKSRAEKARTGIRTLCILLPLMGCTWVIGIFYVNESLDWIQYVFAVCNSLQGLVIFVMHVLCNKQMSIAIQKRRRLYYQSSLASKKTTSSFSMPRVTLSTDSGNFSSEELRRRPSTSKGSTYDSIDRYF
ncbi:hypothetical protein ACF0H5_001746 [Mactra antiquata]